jgi:GNAT superfamily N-acetyltransferase
MKPSVKIIKVMGSQIEQYLTSLAQLRIQVFREYPYLYKGDIAYEREYLQPYLQARDAAFFIVMDNDEVVGASTCIPLWQEDEIFQRPFLQQDFDLRSIMYFGESVLLPQYRGQGIGYLFFQLREKYAHNYAGVNTCAFCAVERQISHPLKPENYQGLNNFWQRLGYIEHPELMTYLSWQEVDKKTSTQKRMIFWLKNIN